MMDPLNEHRVQQQIHVLVCDDHDLIRQALRVVINDEPDMQVTGEASDGEQAIAMAIALQPDAVVMDIQMPRVSGIEATRRIKKLLPNVTVLALTVHDSNEYILSILDAGASGYLTKGIISKEIPTAIRAAINGESILSPIVLKKLLNYALRFPGQKATVPSVMNLTDRQKEMLRMTSKGYSNKTIAKNLSLSENTVKKYMMSVFEVLGVHSRTAAVITAQQLGLLCSGEESSELCE